MTFSELTTRVRRDLGQAHRYEHCVRVARLADRLAYHHAEDTFAARTAGMLHDLARLFSTERLLEECQARAMPIFAYEKSSPILLHARLGAELARERYGVDDEAILSAIRKHTTADAQMSKLDTILYLADSLEPGRSYEGRERLESLAFLDLERALREVLWASAQYLATLGLAVAPPMAQAARVLGITLPEVTTVHTT